MKHKGYKLIIELTKLIPDYLMKPKRTRDKITALCDLVDNQLSYKQLEYLSQLVMLEYPREKPEHIKELLTKLYELEKFYNEDYHSWKGV